MTIDDPLLENAKARAAELQLSVSELIEDALRMVLSKSTTGREKPFTPLTVGGGGVNPNINIDRISEILHQDDMAFYATGKKPARRKN